MTCHQRSIGTLLSGVALLAGVTLVRAQTLDMKLGLWEATITQKSSGVPPIDTSKMTPEQRARVEEALKARQLAPPAPTTRTSKDCITKEKLDKLLPFQRNDPNCKWTVISNSSTVQERKVECTGEHKASGELRLEVLSPESVKTTSKMIVGDGPRTMTIESSGTAKWVGAACGDIK